MTQMKSALGGIPLERAMINGLPMDDGGDLVGLLTMNNAGEFLSVQAAIGGRPAGRRLLGT